MNAIWWIRRDLRLYDNNALHAAMKNRGQVIPLYILNPRLLAASPPRRRAFLFSGLRCLDESLRRLGGELVVRSGKPEEILRQVVQESGASAIYAEEDYTPYSRRRDREVAAGLPLYLQPGLTVCHPASVVKADGSPYRMFSPFRKVWSVAALQSDVILSTLPAPTSLDTPAGLYSDDLPENGEITGFPAGEIEAQERLSRFCSGPIYKYAETRNRLDMEGTSALSPYLRFGMISPRQALAAALSVHWGTDDPQRQAGVEAWINELAWREFYHAILYHFPEVTKSTYNASFRHIEWVNTPGDLQAWMTGQTGYPIVDAAMRQLSQTGWIPNQARMIVASFLIKDLLVNWQEGERWFMQNLIDGDLSANNGGWQSLAGTGPDAEPFFRILNPVGQGKKCDPHGVYIRRWVPELSNVPYDWVHSPWEMPTPVQVACGFHPGRDYPLPVVDHSTARQRALEAYRASKKRSDQEEI